MNGSSVFAKEVRFPHCFCVCSSFLSNETSPFLLRPTKPARTQIEYIENTRIVELILHERLTRLHPTQA